MFGDSHFSEHIPLLDITDTVESLSIIQEAHTEFFWYLAFSINQHISALMFCSLNHGFKNPGISSRYGIVMHTVNFRI